MADGHVTAVVLGGFGRDGGHVGVSTAASAGGAAAGDRGGRAVRPRRAPDDGEPDVRSPPRVAPGSGGTASGPRLHRRPGHDVPDLRADARLPGMRVRGSRPLLRRWPGPPRRRSRRRVPEDGRPGRHVPDRLLRRAGEAGHGLPGAQLHGVGQLLLRRPRPDVPQPDLPAGGPYRPDGEHLRPVHAADDLGPPRRRRARRARVLPRPADARPLVRQVRPAHAAVRPVRGRRLGRRSRRLHAHRPGRARRGRGRQQRRPSARRSPRRRRAVQHHLPRAPQRPELGPHRAHHQLRRVGRLLRPRDPAARRRR